MSNYQSWLHVFANGCHPGEILAKSLISFDVFILVELFSDVILCMPICHDHLWAQRIGKHNP